MTFFSSSKLLIENVAKRKGGQSQLNKKRGRANFKILNFWKQYIELEYLEKQIKYHQEMAPPQHEFLKRE